MKWSPQQEEGLKLVAKWLADYKRDPKNTQQVFRVFGYAGTGKTTLATEFASSVNGSVLFGAYTGKASLVLRSKGAKGANTLHSYLYIPVPESNGKVSFRLNPESKICDASLLVIDECSMVDEELGSDVLSFGCPVLVLGDPAQLPPPSGSGFFTNHKPDVMLTEVHRQAAESPIVWMATRVRKKITLDIGKYGNCSVTNKASMSQMMEADQILCGLNKTRFMINSKVRKKLGMENLFPEKGERLICTASDKKRTGILNGEQFLMQRDLPKKTNNQFAGFKAKSLDRGESFDLKVHHFNFDPSIAEPPYKILAGTQMVTYGYCVTTHKSQGSQWDSTYILDESGSFREDWHRWLYTAITRSAEQVDVLVR